MRKFIQSLFTDGEWDGDVVKVVGFALVVTGVIGWWFGKDPAYIIGFGAALCATGKFSKQG